jgi:hypothetical protein
LKVYVANRANFEINVSGRCARAVRDVFSGKEVLDVPVTIFEEARNEIQDLLEHGAVMRFQYTPQFLDMVNVEEGVE